MPGVAGKGSNDAETIKMVEKLLDLAAGEYEVVEDGVFKANLSKIELEWPEGMNEKLASSTNVYGNNNKFEKSIIAAMAKALKSTTKPRVNPCLEMSKEDADNVWKKLMEKAKTCGEVKDNLESVVKELKACLAKEKAEEADVIANVTGETLSMHSYRGCVKPLMEMFDVVGMMVSLVKLSGVSEDELGLDLSDLESFKEDFADRSKQDAAAYHFLIPLMVVRMGLKLLDQYEHEVFQFVFSKALLEVFKSALGKLVGKPSANRKKRSASPGKQRKIV